MILVVGGRASGKRRYAGTLGYGEGDMSRDPWDGTPVLLDLHELLRERETVDDALFAALLKKAVIVCDEVGCGVVPVRAADRAWRDRVGETCAGLAARADRVVRLCCGIPQVIKDGTCSSR